MIKRLLLVLLFSTLTYSANDVYQQVKTKYGTFANFNAYLSAKGSTPTSLQVGNNWTVSGKVTPPSTFEFFSFVGGAKFYGSTGSGVDTLDMQNCPFTARPSGQWADTSITIINLKVEEVKPEWFGAKGDGITDDTKAWKCLIRSLPGGYSPAADYTVKGHCPKIICNPKRSYKITDSLDFSEKWNLTIEGISRNFSRSLDTLLETFVWYGDSNKSMLYFHYNFGLSIKNVSVNGRDIAGVVGWSLSKTNTANSSIKYGVFEGCAAKNCDVGFRIGDYSANGPDNAALLFNQLEASQCKTSGVVVNSGNATCTFVEPHITQNGYAPRWGGAGRNDTIGCNFRLVAGHVGLYDYVSNGFDEWKPKHADIYQDFGSIGIYGAWSDCSGIMFKQGSNSEGCVLQGIRHYGGQLNDTNTPTSLDLSQKTSILGCYLFGDVVVRSGQSGSITAINNKFFDINLVGQRPDSGIGRFKGDIVTTQYGLVDINNQGNSARIMMGGGTRPNFNARTSNTALGIFGQNLAEVMAPAAGQSGYVITKPNPSNGSFEMWVNCYSNDAGVNFKAFTVGFAKRYNFGQNGNSAYTYYFSDTTTSAAGANFTRMYDFKGTNSSGTPTELVFTPPWFNGAPTFSSGSYWRGGIFYDTASNHLRVSRDGSNQFKKIAMENDTLTFNKLTITQIDSTKIGSSGSTVKELKIIDEASDTLSIIVGAKTWKFLPVANQ
jgi:hypothetical protein